MDQIKAKLSVYFEDPFWVGIYEREEDGQVQVARIVFGSEPKDYEVYAYLLQTFRFLHFTLPIQGEKSRDQAKNPKRMQRQIQKELHRTAVSTKAQEAISRQRELQKAVRISNRHKRSEEEKEQQFLRRQQKKKEKHRGH